MLEKDMEELIATYPTEFFPRYNFTLIGRQGTFEGIGRYDILFKDERGTNILVELKARSAKYRDADQIAKYNDALKGKGVKNIILWLIATNIPQSIREFLDNIGIEYTEIHETEYRRVAEKVGYKFSLVETDNNIEFNLQGQRTNTIIMRENKMYNSRVSKDFKNSLEKIKGFFVAAYSFLTEIISGYHDGFWISTAKNAHLYYKDFIFILKFLLLKLNFMLISMGELILIQKIIVERSFLAQLKN